MCACVLMSFYKDASLIGFGLCHMASFYLNHLLKDHLSKYSHILRCEGSGLQHVNPGVPSSAPSSIPWCLERLLSARSMCCGLARARSPFTEMGVLLQGRGSWAVTLGLNASAGPPPSGVAEGLGFPRCRTLRAPHSSRVSASWSRHGKNSGTLSFQVLYSLLTQSEDMSGWPQVVSEDIVKQVHKLKNEMLVMGGKIKGKTLLPIPEHLQSPDGTPESVER